MQSSASSQAPLWTPDAKYIIYRATRHGFRNLFWKPADGSGEEERFTTSESTHTPVSWSPDGKWLAFTDVNPASGNDIAVLPMEGDRRPQVFLKRASQPHFSPDGRWMAYSSEESGRPEVYVRPFQRPGGKTQISTEGGDEPVWSRDGRELFYINGDKTMAVPVQTNPSFSAGSPRLLFSGRFLPSPNGVAGYDVSADGKRFLKVQPTSPDEAASQITVVINWSEELRASQIQNPKF